MTDKPVTKKLFEQEHSEIEQITRMLYHVLAEHREPRSRVLDLLTMLRERVVAHFKDEEPTGSVGAGTHGDAELTEKRKALCEDHTAITGRLTRIIQLAEEGTIQPEWWNELERQFHAVSFEITNHESREQALLDEIRNKSSS